MAIAREKRQEEHDRDMWLAWHIAALQRQEKLPKLETLLTQKPQKRKQTAREQVAMWQIIAARFGGTFTPVVKECQ